MTDVPAPQDPPEPTVPDDPPEPAVPAEDDGLVHDAPPEAGDPPA
jgi:hypothetical protein